MTRHLPPDMVVKLSEAVALREGLIAGIFKQSEPWQVRAALAALYRFRPDLGASDDRWHRVHMEALGAQSDGGYFLRVCKLLKLFGVGGDE